jgi:predicted transposase YbfD/YdcC
MDSNYGIPRTLEVAVLDKFVACFEGLKDPRTGNAGLHDLHELLVIALCTVLSGGQGATHMAAFAVAKESFLRGFLKLENGLPSHDTFSRLFRLLDPEQFRIVFQRFMARFAETVQGVVAIDGKVLRRSFDKASGKSALHMVSAWGCDQRMVLAQIATDAKSNEITAVPKLLEMLCLKGTIVTVDALNCQREIAQKIIDKGGEYALALKANQVKLHNDVIRPLTICLARHWGRTAAMMLSVLSLVVLLLVSRVRSTLQMAFRPGQSWSFCIFAMSVLMVAMRVSIRP